MIDQDLAIEPPPSLQAILSHRERIGRVDFTHRLVADPPPPRAEDEDGHAAEPPSGPETGHITTPAGTDAPAETAAAAGDTAPGPAPAEAPAPEPSEPQTSEAQASEAPTPDRDETDQADQPAGSAGSGPHLDPDDFLVAPPADSAATFAPAEASAQVAALLSLVPAEDMDTVTEDVSEVVEGVLARIREVRSATLAHLEAIEVEAALRCEMLTAQAELDAELIRLHARREAHAIVAAARARSGMPPAADDVRRLDHLAGAASRLVESLEELGPRPGSPDHLYLP